MKPDFHRTLKDAGIVAVPDAETERHAAFCAGLVTGILAGAVMFLLLFMS